MSQTSKFHDNPVLYATKRPLIINDVNFRVATAAGLLRTFPTTVIYFDIGTIAAFPNAASVNFYTTTAAGRRSCYLLPYYPGADVEIVVDGNADYFFTSNLSGCGVQVQDDVGGNLKVIHSNARNVFDTSGAAAARLAITGRLAGYRAASPGNATRITKATQEADFTAAATNNLAGIGAMAKPTQKHAQVTTITVDGNAAALSGAFFGVSAGGWRFYSQVSSGATGTQNQFFGLGKTVNLDLGALVVMGPPVQMWPDTTGTYAV
jgi:hypothetical protein